MTSFAPSAFKTLFAALALAALAPRAARAQEAPRPPAQTPPAEGPGAARAAVEDEKRKDAPKEEEKPTPSEVRGPSPAPFEPGPGDTSYGRIEGDLSIAAGLGATFAPGGARGTADLRIRYLQTVGLFATYEDGFGGSIDPTRVFAGGLEVRPLFLARWLQGWNLHQSFVDLLLDSFSFDLGLTATQPLGKAWVPQPGLQLGLGLEVPLFAKVTGLWIGAHGGMRFGFDALAYGDTSTATQRAPYLGLTLAWHQLLPVWALVDLGDRPVQ